MARFVYIVEVMEHGKTNEKKKCRSARKRRSPEKGNTCPWVGEPLLKQTTTRDCIIIVRKEKHQNRTEP